MEKLINDFGNYMISVQINKNKEFFIKGSIINHPNKNELIKYFRPEDETENKIEEITLPNGTKKTNVCYSQIKEWINVLELHDNEEVKNKLKEYLNQLLKFKN